MGKYKMGRNKMGNNYRKISTKATAALSIAAAFNISAYGATISHSELLQQIEALKSQLQMLEKQVGTITAEKNITSAEVKRIEKLEKKVASNSKTISKVKAHDSGDNLKFDVDFRTQFDSLEYKLGSGAKVKNEALMSNRLWLGMKYQADENTIFRGKLSYNKVFGDNRATADGNVGNNAEFDWVTNEAATNDNSLKVKEAYWLYTNDSFMGNNKLPWTVSVGRRPSTDGLGINLRVNQQDNSPLSHNVNVEFDGASLKFDLEKLTSVSGMWIKFCGGRGLTNAKLRFSSDGLDYTKDANTTKDVDMLGFIFTPYDDGQYKVAMNYAKAWNLIGNQDRDSNGVADSNGKFYDFGDIHYFTTMFKVDGIGNEINEFLDNSIFFASYAMSRTSPKAGDMMLGSTDAQTGHSYWLGINTPDGFSHDGRFGLEWNKGSKYWRAMTYGEDTMIGSKLAARGTAWEVYYNKPLTKALTSSIRFTKIDYDYTGSNGFFGDLGAPMSTGSAQAANAVKEAQNLTAYIKYSF